ncbi:MAG: tripartite tricarboxylate transporter TctB family protein [Halomonas sp.]|uniref:tripartite tricarboxylate transporter TctB family protein n=1 Tax=Halomonas sp. TaxID=1486246 RepID=UPI003F8E7828
MNNESASLTKKESLEKLLFSLFLYLFFLMISSYFIYESLEMPAPYTPNDIGAGRLPLIISTLTLSLSCLGLIFSSLKIIGKRKKIDEKSNANFSKPLLAIVLISFTSIGFSTMGIYISLWLLVAGLVFIAGTHKWWIPLATASAFLLMTYLLFDLALSIPLQ